jgi:SpoVK/Ycf46/Vps4 family AAA+-type ATPase
MLFTLYVGCRGVAESIILNLPNKLTSEHRVLVLENIDEFTTRSSSGESIRDTNDMSMSDAFLTDALNQCIDAVVSRFPTCFILATSAVGAEAVSKAEKQGSLHVDQGVTQMHRLGSVLHLQPLGKADRAELIHSMLSLIEDNGEVFIDETVEKFLMNLSSNLLPTKELQRCDYMNMLSKEIASRTPGLSALDLISLIKLHTQEISTESAKPGRVSISAAKLLTASAEATPSDVISGASRDVFQLMNDVSDAAELPGYENILQELVDETLGFYSGPLEVREMYHRLGLTPTSGIVISGPSGVGKTALARLLGKRCQNYFKFISVSCAELVHKVVGETEQKLTQLFASARAMAPCFVLLDNLEIIMGGDPIAPSGDSNMRSDDGDVEGLPETEEAKRLRMSHLFNSKRTSSQAFDRLLSTLLIEIDGIGPLGALRNEGSSIAYRDDLKGGSLSADDMYNQGPVIVIATTTDASLLDR